MNLETFFEKFELFTEAPNAVAKMRKVILQLAVQGKLVDQDSNDEQANELVQRIIATKTHLVQTKIIKSEAPLDTITKEEALFSIPDGWTWVRAGELCYPISSGSTPDQNVFHPSEGIPYLKVYNIRNQVVDFEYKRQFIDVKYHEEKMKRSKLFPGDVIMNIVGPPLGKVAIVPETFSEWNCNQAIAFFRPIISELAQYLYIFLKEGSFLRNIQLIGTAGQDNISVTKCKFIPIPLPPLAEQKRIAAKVDELMALCDHLENQQRELEIQHTHLARASLSRFAEAPTPENLEFLFHKSYDVSPAELQKSILTLAVRGKLVSHDIDDSTAEQLLERIGQRRAELIDSDSLRRSKPCRQFSSDEAPYVIPASWVWTMLGDITDIGTGSTPSRTEANFWVSGTIPWITSGLTSRPAITQGEEFVTPEAVKAHRLRVYPPGTLLVALYGQGKTRGQVTTLEIPATINQACAAICALDGIESMQGYLKLLLEKQYDEMRLMAAGGAQPNLNVQKIKEVFVPLPPLAEQHRIVAKVDQLMTLVNQLEIQLATARSTASILLDALVAELTKQDQSTPNPPGSITNRKPILEQTSLFED
jgi:type I restriction enzyme, S subunit